MPVTEMGRTSKTAGSQEFTESGTANVYEGIIIINSSSPITVTLPPPPLRLNGSRLAVKALDVASHSVGGLFNTAQTALTFSGLLLGFVDLIAHNGRWQVVSNINVIIS